MGQSYSIYKGVKNSHFEDIITIDGDGQNDPIDIMKLIKLYNTSTYGLVGGLRLKRKIILLNVYLLYLLIILEI